MSNADYKIIIQCTANIGLVGCDIQFPISYYASDFEGLTAEEILAIVEQDAHDRVIQEYLSVDVTLPAELTEASS